VLSAYAHHFSRHLRRGGFAALLFTGAFVCTATLAHAQEFLSIKGNTVNVRAKPSTQAVIAWELINGYPVQVVSRQDDWVQVKDFEGPLGWVHKPLTSTQPHFLVKSNNVNLRSGPGTNHSVVTKLSKYDILQTLEKKNGWAKVKTPDGMEGWLLEQLAWGW